MEIFSAGAGSGAGLKLAYSAPVLKVFGDVALLTTGGTGPTNEPNKSSNAQKKNKL